LPAHKISVYFGNQALHIVRCAENTGCHEQLPRGISGSGNEQVMKTRSVIGLLLCVLLLPASHARASDDIFSIMFRMMLTMMNVMANSMNNNHNFNNWGGNNWGLNNAWGNGLSMAGYPMMSGLGGMGGWPGMSSWSGMNPWSGYGGLPATGMGMSPWSYAPGVNSWSNAWGNNPFMSGMNPAGIPGTMPAPYPGIGYGGYQQDYSDTNLLDGTWYGVSGDVLEIHGDRFRLVAGQMGITGVVRIDNNIISLYSPDTDTLTQYTFVRNQTELLLQDVTGEVLAYRRYPFGYVF